MKKTILLLLTIITIFSSCEQKKPDPTNTIFFFYPWSTNLTNDFEGNIANFEYGITHKDLEKNRVVVFISKTESTAYMYEIKSIKGKIKHDTIAQYDNYEYRYTSTEGFTEILNIAKGATPTPQFSMIIGCHGDAWIPAADMKRSFGGANVESRIDISTLRNALKKSNLTAEYILFDDCYMSSIEVAYELRDVCRHLIASPAEIMAAGMPFRHIATDLLNTPNYEAICNDFYNHYANDLSAPYGAIAIINCQELNQLANIVKQINTNHQYDDSKTDDLQIYDGYTPNIFYDLGDYIASYCTDANLLQQFNTQMQQCITHKAHTEYIYSYGHGTIKIKKYSGLSTSAPSTNSKCASYTETEWYKATH
jgi:hypothetical protein